MRAERLIERWVACYTRGLPEDARAGRRAEIASDLWEQRDSDGSGLRADLMIASRTLRGMWSDVSWRRAQRPRRVVRSITRPLLRTLAWTIAAASYLLVVSLHGFATTALVGLDLYGEDWAPGDVGHYARICGVLFALLVGGAAMLRRLPVLGAMLVVVALVGQALVFWWAAPITLPLGATIATAAVVIATRCADARQPRARSAAS